MGLCNWDFSYPTHSSLPGHQQISRQWLVKEPELLGIAWQGVCCPQTGWFAGGLEGDLSACFRRNHCTGRGAAPFFRELFYPGTRLVQGHYKCQLSRGAEHLLKPADARLISVFFLCSAFPHSRLALRFVPDSTCFQRPFFYL